MGFLSVLVFLLQAKFALSAPQALQALHSVTQRYTALHLILQIAVCNAKSCSRLACQLRESISRFVD